MDNPPGSESRKCEKENAMATTGSKTRKALGVFALAALIPVSGWAFGGPGMGGRFHGPPQEAFDACAGKKAGDQVTFRTPFGDNVTAACREFDGKLAAAPGRGYGRDGWGRGRWGRGDGSCLEGPGPRRVGWERGMGPGRHFGRIAWELGLTAEQEKQIRGIFDAEREHNEPLRRQLREYREQLHGLAWKTPFDEAGYRKIAAEREKTRTELNVSRVRAMNKAYALLTPEQREKAERIGPRGGGFGPWHSDRPWGR